MFIVYCLEEEEKNNDSEVEQESKSQVDCNNALNLLFNLDLPHIVIKVKKYDTKKQNLIRDLILKYKDVNSPAPIDPISLPQIFSLDILEDDEEEIIEKLINFEQVDLSSEAIFHVGSFIDLRELILKLLRLSPEIVWSYDDEEENSDSQLITS